MTGRDRWVVLGLAQPRADWFRDVARWSTGATIPVDFVKCVSPDEARARLVAGRPFSALLVGGDVIGLDRDLVATAGDAGAATIVVNAPSARDWSELGVAAVLPPDFDPDDLRAALRDHCAPIDPVASSPVAAAPTLEPGWRGRVVAVTGPGGAGASVAAMALAQAFAAEPSNAGMILLADLARDADQALLHDARDVAPGVLELTEAHRGQRLPVDEVRALAFEADGRGYHLLLGLRRHRDWTAVRPRAFASALDSLRRSYRLVVADIDPDLEDERTTGSLDVEDRHAMARLTLEVADRVVVVGTTDTKGLHALRRSLSSILGTGISPDRVTVACNRASRRPRRRAEVVAALRDLLRADDHTTHLGNPVFLPERPDLEAAIRDGLPVPTRFGRTLHSEVRRAIDRQASAPAGSETDPQPVAPGSLGHFSEEAG